MNQKKERGQLIVLSGPSGVGKSTVIAELFAQNPTSISPSPTPPGGSPGWGAGWRNPQLLSPGRSLSG